MQTDFSSKEFRSTVGAFATGITLVVVLGTGASVAVTPPLWPFRPESGSGSYGHDDFRKYCSDALAEYLPEGIDTATRDWLIQRLYFHSGDFDQTATFGPLKDLLTKELSGEPLYPIIHLEGEDIEIAPSFPYKKYRKLQQSHETMDVT